MPCSRGYRGDRVIAYIPAAHIIARQTARRLGRPEDAEDFAGAALEGLVLAGHRYDPQRGVPFTSFAKHRVRGAIMDAVRTRDFVPRSVRSRARLIESATRAFVARQGRPPSMAELAGTLGLTETEAHTLVGKTETKPVLSLSGPMPDGSSGDDVRQEAPDALHDLLRRQQRVALQTALGELPERERIAVAMFYIEERPLKAIGAILGVSPSRVSQLCSRGLERLREALVEHQL